GNFYGLLIRIIITNNYRFGFSNRNVSICIFYYLFCHKTFCPNLFHICYHLQFISKKSFINCTYLNEAFFGDELQEITYVEKIGTKSFVTKQVLKNADTDISIAEAESVIVSYDYPNKQSIEIPEELLCNLKIYVKEN